MSVWQFLNDNWFWFALFGWMMFNEWLDYSRLEQENKRLTNENERLQSKLAEIMSIREAKNHD